MRCIYISALLVTIVTLCGCRVTPQPGLSEVIEFRYEPSFSPRIVIQLERDSKGAISGQMFRRGLEENPSRQVLHEFKVSSQKFERLVAAIESSEFKAAAEGDPIIGVDGTTYVFARSMGNRFLQLRIWNPGLSPKISSARLALQLAHEFIAAAGVEDFTNAKNANFRPAAATGPRD
jgi:hypothetical protein